ncbi:unnamed protein product [Mycena citricolor]|uniref:DUF6697 domain-containing protein n=1 Tax=Mycena citricolor TaxID=2018698 RepID=A0AAD2JY28_9AGAR|nr:unnamed protein product [Mycena citricolor]
MKPWLCLLPISVAHVASVPYLSSMAAPLTITPVNVLPSAKELLEIKKGSGTPSLKPTDPFSVLEMVLEVEVERKRATEALSARDAAIQRLSEAYVSLRQKMCIIDRLQQQSCQGKAAPNEQVLALESTIKSLREELAAAVSKVSAATEIAQTTATQENGIDHTAPGGVPLYRPFSALDIKTSDTPISQHILYSPDQLNEPEDLIKARHDFLMTMPLPAEPPDDTLKPILLPPPFTLHEFLANATGRASPLFRVPTGPSARAHEAPRLNNYRVFQEPTTSWCPEREEHGYMLMPLFKCTTNPRVTTAHRWNVIDVTGRMSKPTECFYNKDGNWYYAGVYKGFRMADLTPKEWDALSAETTQALVKETIAGRKNTSPQNIYETSQLYSCGALRVACVGLQCVGFNKPLYHAILDQAAKCALVAGKWKSAATAGMVSGAAAGASLNAGLSGPWPALGDGAK